MQRVACIWCKGKPLGALGHLTALSMTPSKCPPTGMSKLAQSTKRQLQCTAGVALGGGVGIAANLWGPAVDSVLGIDVVSTWKNNSADWDIVRINATSHPDLFWGMLVSTV